MTCTITFPVCVLLIVIITPSAVGFGNSDSAFASTAEESSANEDKDCPLIASTPVCVVVVVPASNSIQLIFQLIADVDKILIVCCPAGKVTFALTVVQT